MKASIGVVVISAVAVFAIPAGVAGQRAATLRGVKTIQVNETVIGNPEKVKEDFAASFVEDSLRKALRDSNLEVVEEAPIQAHIVLDEFSSGSTAKRLLVGFGSGRSTVDGRLVLRGADGRDLANLRIRVRGNLVFSGYEGAETQRRQATSAFSQRLIEEIARLK